jgi:hypothetical protein
LYPSKKHTISDKHNITESNLSSNLWFLYSPTCKTKYQKDYTFFTKRIGLSLNLVKETPNIIKRSMDAIDLYGRKIANTLFITLHQICSNQYYILIGGIGMNQEIKEALTLVLTKLENLEESGIRSLKGELSSLYGYIGIFRSDTIRDQNKNETYLKVLTKQIYDMQKTLDFVRAHIERQREWDEED